MININSTGVALFSSNILFEVLYAFMDFGIVSGVFGPGT